MSVLNQQQKVSPIFLMCKISLLPLPSLCAPLSSRFQEGTRGHSESGSFTSLAPLSPWNLVT